MLRMVIEDDDTVYVIGTDMVFDADEMVEIRGVAMMPSDEMYDDIFGRYSIWKRQYARDLESTFERWDSMGRLIQSITPVAWKSWDRAYLPLLLK